MFHGYKLGQKITDDDDDDDDDDIHRGERSTEVKCGNYVIWLPHLVRCTAKTS